MKMRIIVSFFIIVFLFGCTSGFNIEEKKNPDIQGRIVVVDARKNKVDVFTDNGIYPLKVTSSTQIINKKTGNQLILKDLDIRYRADVWFVSEGDQYFANHIIVSRITQSDLLPNMLSSKEGEYNIYLYSKKDGLDVYNHEVVQQIMNNEKYNTILNKIKFNDFNNLSVKVFNIKKSPTILVLDNENIVLQAHDFNKLLKFFKECTENVRVKTDQLTFKGESKHWKAVLKEDYKEVWRKNKSSYENYVTEKLDLTYKEKNVDIIKNVKYHYQSNAKECSGNIDIRKKGDNFFFNAKNQGENREITRCDDNYFLKINWNGKKETMRLKSEK
ncbi:MAG: hypothetical protein K9L17_00775 [Clostridiales bacterium]|nr:hypothetical protein [Clostridiales bacterium]MCF8021226.1 hypothetical protein [Clostridiales bacterium]